MRDRIVLGGLALLLVWLAVFGTRLLARGHPAIWATPTSEAAKPADLRPITIPAGGRACADHIPFGPEARYVSFRVLPAAGAAAGPLTVEATDGGAYRAQGRVPAGLARGARAIARIPAAEHEAYGTLCLRNDGPRPLDVAGVPRNGSYASASRLDVGGTRVTDRELSLTLLSATHRSMAARLGSILSHVAAFRPVGAWFVWIVLALLLAGVPVAALRALRWAARADEVAPEAPTGRPPGDSSPPSAPPSAPR